jgi:hypothetical protein
VRRDFKMLEVKVPIIFFGTQGWTLISMYVRLILLFAIVGFWNKPFRNRCARHYYVVLVEDVA